MPSSIISSPLKLVLQYALTVLLLWGMTQMLPQYLVIGGGTFALPIVAALVMLLNMFVRPVLNVLALPLKLFATILAVILTNALFLWLLESVAEKIDPLTAQIVVAGGLGGWIVVALLLGFGNWIIHHIA